MAIVNMPVYVDLVNNTLTTNKQSGSALTSGSAYSSSAMGVTLVIYGNAWLSPNVTDAGTIDIGVGPFVKTSSLLELSNGAGGVSCAMPYFFVVGPNSAYSLYCKSDGPGGAGNQGFSHTHPVVIT